MLGRFVTITCLLCMVACTGNRGTRVAPGSERLAEERKVIADAYSFDARLKRDGKPTTFQLEIYRMDTLLGFSGKGYLGKGALKGRLTRDSLVVYFPASNEYLQESLDDLLESSTCPLPMAQVRLFDLFKTLPDSLALPKGIVVESDYHVDDKPEFFMTAADCDWSIELTYDRKDDHWAVRHFRFEKGESLSLRGNRTRFKTAANVKTLRFRVDPPPSATRIIP